MSSQKEIVIEGRVFDGLFLAKFVADLLKPIRKTEAYNLGLVDKDGVILREPKTREEKRAVSLYKRLIFKIKRLIGGPKLKLLTVGYLLRETQLIPMSDAELIERTKKLVAAKQIYVEFRNRLEEAGITEDEFVDILIKELRYNA